MEQPRRTGITAVSGDGEAMDQQPRQRQRDGHQQPSSRSLATENPTCSTFPFRLTGVCGPCRPWPGPASWRRKPPPVALAAARIRFHARSRSASLTPSTWSNRAIALRTCRASVSGSLRSLGNANSLSAQPVLLRGAHALAAARDVLAAGPGALRLPGPGDVALGSFFCSHGSHHASYSTRVVASGVVSPRMAAALGAGRRLAGPEAGSTVTAWVRAAPAGRVKVPVAVCLSPLRGAAGRTPCPWPAHIPDGSCPAESC